MKSLVFFIVIPFVIFGCVTETKTVHGIRVKEQSESSKDKERSDLYLSMGQNYEAHNEITRATQSYQEAINYNKKNHKAYLALGQVLIQRGFVKKGLSFIRKSIEINPQYTQALNYLAYYYSKKGFSEAAYRYIQKSADDLVYEDQERIWSLKLNLERKLGKKEKLKSTIYKAQSTSVQNCKPRTLIAYNLALLGKKTMALESVKRAASVCKSEAEENKLNFVRGVAYYKNGDYVVAEEILKKVDSEDPALQKTVPRLLKTVKRKVESTY